MYSWEIEKYLSKRNKELTPKEFIDVINTSPQVNEVLYKPENNFRIKTDENISWDVKLIEDKPKSLKLEKKATKNIKKH